jgi:mRNA degradation ribonuclease J1/J2
MESISVPVTLVSLAAAIEVRLAALTPDSNVDDVWTIIKLSEKLERTLDRMAREYEPITAISTVAA